MALKKRQFEVKSPSGISKAGKAIDKAMASLSAKELRKRMIESAYLIRDTVAKKAPRDTFAKIIMGTPLEKFENYNSGFDVTLNGKYGVTFVLKLSSENFNKGTYANYNPVIGLFVSNYGRPAIHVNEDNKIPVASEKGWKKYNHPTYKYGHKSMYSGMSVNFVTDIEAEPAEMWIEKGISGATTKANNVLAGKTEYNKKNTSDMYWG